MFSVFELSNFQYHFYHVIPIVKRSYGISLIFVSLLVLITKKDKVL